MKVKKVKTYYNGVRNGSLIELYKNGNKTLLYLTTIKEGGFKGYHLHKIREANYVVIKGKIQVDMFTDKKETCILKPLDTLHIPNNVATGLTNIGKGEAWLINYPNPAYDPNAKDEQVEFTLEELFRS